MADKGNPTIDKIKLRLEQGYTIEELRAIAEEKGLMNDEVTAFFDSYNTESSQKKNSSSDLDLETPSMDLSVDGGDSESQESTATETSLGEDTEDAFDQKVEDARATGMQGALGKLYQDTQDDLKQWREVRSLSEAPQPPKDFSGKEITLDLINSMEGDNPLYKVYKDSYDEYQNLLRIYNSSEEDIKQRRMSMEAESVNKAYEQLSLASKGEESVRTGDADLSGHSENNFIIYDKDGKLVINPSKTAATFAAIDEATKRREAIIAEEVAKLSTKGFAEELGYDLWTGVRSLGNSFVASFDEEKGAVNEYYNSLRTQASFTEAGLTEEDVAEGITGNLAKGNLYAAGTILATNTIQQIPQIASQVAIAYATGGMGLGASASYFASSAFMGVSAYGSTIASYKGLVDDDKLYTMAVGDALVEFISERALTGDVADILGKSTLKGMSVDEVRKTMFKKGLLSKEFGGLLASTGAKLADSGSQEFVEELIAGIGSGLVHSAINDEEFSLLEVMDGALVGFSSGSMSGGIRASRRLLTGGASALGYGGFRSEMLKINNTRQALAEELRNTTDANAKATIQEKIDGLDRLSVQVSQEQSEAYDQYSDEDADATVKHNREVKDALIKLRTDKNLTQEQKTELQNKVKESYNQIQQIESKYEGIKADIKKQKETNQEWLNSQETSVEVNEDTKLPDTPLMNGIKMVAKALSNKGSKVYIHRNLDDAAEVTGRDKMTLAGSNGFFIADDGSVHIMAAQAQQNTAYHEGFHRILREVDAGYAKRFVDAAFKGMDDATRAKYQKIYNRGIKQGGQALAVEETFAELAADVTAGAISVEGAGTSIVRAAMGSLGKALQKIGVPVKPNASFKEFANYVNAVVKDFQEGKESTETKGRFGSNQVQEGKFNQFSEVVNDWLKENLSEIVYKKVNSIESSEAIEAIEEIILDETYEESIGAIESKESINEFMPSDSFTVTEIIENIVDASSEKDFEVFTFGLTQYNVTEALDLVKNNEVKELSSEQTSKLRMPFIYKNPERINEVDIKKPVLLATTEKGVMLIDGHHRVEKAHIENKGVKYKVLTIEQTESITDNQVSRQKAEGNNGVFFQMQDPMTTAGMVAEMNELATKLSIDPDALTETEKESAKIKVKELSERLGFDFNEIKYEDWTDVPMVFSISDQLTSGDVVNPNTGNTITNLMGGLGFHGAHPKHADLAWANIDDQTALDQINQAKEVYENNKELYDELWASGKVKQGHVVMGIVRMGNSSMNSNEAVLRVAADNLTAFPLENRQKAFTALVERLETQIAQNKKSIESGVGTTGTKLTALSIKNMEKANGEMQDVLDKAKENNITEVSELMNTEFLKKLNTIAAVAHITNNLLYGKAFEVGQDSKRLSAPKISPAIALMEGMEDSKRELINKGFIMNIITEEQMKGVPQRSLVALTAVDITENGGLGESAHPNYPAAAKGYPIGIFGNPKSIVQLMPKVKEQLTYYATAEATGDVKELSTSNRMTQRVPVQTGLGNIELRGSAINENQESSITDLFARSFPYVNFFSDEATLQKAKDDKDSIPLVNKNGVTYAYRLGNRVFFDEAVFNSQSELGKMQMAEMAEFWVEQMMTSKNGRAILEQGLSIIKETPQYKKNENSYKDADVAAKDLLIKAIAEKGNNIQDAAKRSKFINWVSGVYAYIKDSFGIKSKDVKAEDIANMTVNDVVNVALADILGGKPTKVTAGQMRKLTKPQEDVSPRQRIFFQSTIVNEVSERILLGEKKAEIIASLRAKGMSRADANLVYAKASQYAKGARKGWNEGRRELSKKHAEERREARRKESEQAKDFRKKAKAILAQEKKSGDIIIREIINLIKESGVNIKASQVQTLIRLTKKVSRLKGKNALNPDARYNVFNSVIDRVVAIIEKQETAAGLATYINTLRSVEAEQKKLKSRLKNLKPNSRSPLISYAEQILDITSINPSMLSKESLELLQQALKDLNNTTKTVSVKKGELSNPYIEIEGIGKVDFRRAKIYFDNIFEQLKVEEVAQNERQLVQEASDRAFEKGTDWVSEYDNILRERAEKELKGIEKKMNEIAKEMDLDLNDINDFEAAIALLNEEKQEALKLNKDVIINDAILPNFLTFRRIYEKHPEFAAIFGVTESLEDEQAAEIVKDRMQNLKPLELKRLEFMMYDFAVNGKALGVSSLRAIVEVANDSNPALKALNIKSVDKQSQVTKGIFSRFENTPTFLRRIFRASEVKIAQFMDITGFASLRQAVAIADSVSNEFDNRTQAEAKRLGFNTIAQQTRLQIYSLLSQVPEGVNKTKYLAQVFANLELAYESDKRFDEKQRAEIREVLDEMYTNNKKKNYDELMSMYEGVENLTEMIEFVRSEFGAQQPMMQSYAEEFLGMNFKEENNYLPIKYRNIGSRNEQISALQEDITNINQAFRAHSMTRANSQASSTFERNENAMGSKTRYVDLNFFAAMSKSFRENEIKHRSAPAVAKVSAATSENNDTFRGIVTDAENRKALRKKIVQFLLNEGTFNESEELFPKWLKKSISSINDLTVLYYFSSVFTQTLKQMGAILNTVTEGDFMDTFGYAYLVATGRLNKDMKELLNKADIGGRDYIEQVVNLQSAKSTMQGKNWKQKMFDLSTAALRKTDKLAATASWLVYYEQYMVNELKEEKGQWDKWNGDFNQAAASYASTMVAKDQNISTARDKSEFNRIDKKSVGSVIQRVIMPFANFLLNKKMNMMLDVRNLGKKETRSNAISSLAGTALEVTAFHAVSQFVIAPLITSLASAFTGAGEEEEEESWYDWEFRKKMFIKGVGTDMNPYILPIGAIESKYTELVNMLDYVTIVDDSMKHDFADRSWYENFQAWERANGLPKFGQRVGRSDMGWVNTLRSTGVYGDMTVELATSIANLKTLNEKNPYYISTFGSVKYVSPEDADRMIQLESAKAIAMMGGAITGLFSKEVVQTIKARERQISKRAVGNENEAIARILMQDKELGKELIQDKIDSHLRDNATGIEGQINAVVGERTIRSVAADSIPSKRHINTIRQINAATQDPRDAAMMAKRVMADLSPSEAEQFYNDFMKYYAVKEGESAVVKIAIILKDR